MTTEPSTLYTITDENVPASISHMCCGHSRAFQPAQCRSQPTRARLQLKRRPFEPLAIHGTGGAGVCAYVGCLSVRV